MKVTAYCPCGAVDRFVSTEDSLTVRCNKCGQRSRISDLTFKVDRQVIWQGRLRGDRANLGKPE
jgi:uncharacterized Zn finger protein